jgi:uncharacterized protein (TIGR02996 family)
VDEREALIQTIIDNPNDDAARLVYADWQQEHGDEAHAELIRLQCARAAKKGKPSARERELLKRPENAVLIERGNTFERGFVTEARYAAGGVGPEGPVNELEDVPLDRVLFVNCCDYGDDWPTLEEAKRLAKHAVARRVRRIAFFEYTLDAAILRALAKSPHLLNLREVGFNSSGTESAALGDLLLAKSVRGVERLLIYGDTDFTDLAGPLPRVLADPRAARLRLLSVTPQYTAASLGAALLAAPDLPELHVRLPHEAEWLTPEVRAALRAKYGKRVTFPHAPADAADFD